MCKCQLCDFAYISSMKYVIALIIACCTALGAWAQEGKISVVSWNVENLFDCTHDTLKDDREFLPEGAYRWTRGRYWRKLDNVARTLAALADEERWPDLVGLCEVENDTVMRDLTRRSPLRVAAYNYVMTDSPDRRGVDVVLMYQPSRFSLLRHEAVRIPSESRGLRPTRDILHVVGRVDDGDTLHVLVVHLPSRVGNSKAARENRVLAAEVLTSVVDTLWQKHVLVMGDFNAEPGDEVFSRLTPPLHSLIPQGWKAAGQGTYFFRNRWCYLDHMLLSPSLFGRSEKKKARVADLPFLLTTEGRPWRTFQGTAYSGGVSDHLPLTAEIFTSRP